MKNGGDEQVYGWHKQVQRIVDGIDRCIENRDNDGLTLRAIAQDNGYSEFHMTRKFKELSGITLREYLRKRRLAFALIDLRDMVFRQARIGQNPSPCCCAQGS